MTHRGRIRTFIPNRNHGFIFEPETNTEYFFHTSQFTGEPALSMQVTFEVAPPIKEGLRLQAVKVTPIDPIAAVLSRAVKS